MKRYFCLGCRKYFSIDYRRKEELFWITYVDGVPFRKLGNERGFSGKQAYWRVMTELKLLPTSVALTKEYCVYTSGILIVDGKYVKVRGCQKKIPWLYVIDYETHDILFGILVPAEDEQAFLKLFQILQSLRYPLKIVVADDRTSLPLALKKVYPEVPVQLCQNHYLENIRQALHFRTDPTHRHFFNSLKKHVFDEYENDEKLDIALHHILTERSENILLRQMIVMEISRRRKELFVYKTIPNCPNNTNLIELFNSHYSARFKAFKGFKTKEHAALILNGMIIRRRTKEFTDCCFKFKHLNGKCSLQMAIKKQAEWPEILGVKAPKR